MATSCSDWGGDSAPSDAVAAELKRRGRNSADDVIRERAYFMASRLPLVWTTGTDLQRVFEESIQLSPHLHDPLRDMAVGAFGEARFYATGPAPSLHVASSASA